MIRRVLLLGLSLGGGSRGFFPLRWGSVPSRDSHGAFPYKRISQVSVFMGDKEVELPGQNRCCVSEAHRRLECLVHRMSTGPRVVIEHRSCYLGLYTHNNRFVSEKRALDAQI